MRMRRPTEEEWNAWLDEHRRVDRGITRAYQWRLRARWAVPNWLERRRWTPGMFYLDHGSEPCVLVRLCDREALEGVSLVDGRLVGGCSIYACGPEPIDRERALEMAEQLREDRLAEAWDAGGEAVVEWVNASPPPSGIWSDPPRNPYRSDR